MSPKNKKIERIACYIRVSTQEQKLHGISLDAQRDKLKEYAEKHKLKIVGWYEDEGVSGRKLIKNRPALQRMIKDAQAGKFDRIIFIKLDRFFRSVAEYHECMKLIDPVIWTATEEKYDLSTANGKAFVNMKLTIAELEADTTSERIKLVNEYKAKTGQAVTGSQRLTFGYCVQKIDGVKRVVKDPNTKDICDEVIKYFITHQNKAATCRWVYDTYNVKFNMNPLTNFLRDTKIYGYYKGNTEYCEPYVDKATYDKIQDILDKNIKATRSKLTYLFSGLIDCPCCGKKLTATNNYYKNKRCNVTLSYRCNTNAIYKEKQCEFNKTVGEKKIEKALINNLDQYVTEYIEVAKIEDKRVRDSHATDKIKEIKAEMSRLTNAYRKGRISEAEYDREYDELDDRLKELQVHLEPIVERDLSVYENLIKSDWKDLYEALNAENKRAFWRKYIKEIKLNMNGTVNTVIFF